jgi:hypothetical protein
MGELTATAYADAVREFPAEVFFKRRSAEVQKWQALRPRLDGLIADTDRPKDAAEAADVSGLCRQPFVKPFVAAARMYARACAADRKCADDLSTLDRRSDAARSAALAGADAPTAKIDRADLHRQAVAWLTMNRQLFAARFTSGGATERNAVADDLSLYLNDRDLACVRPGAAREDWSPTEVAAWDALWLEVRELLARPR